jgi:hypothetical protein
MEIRTHDALGRRLRSKPRTSGESVVLNARDIEWFSALHRHGYLGTSYLHEFTKNTHKSVRATAYRLRELFHEGRYLERPYQQFDTRTSHWNELVHGLSQGGVEFLKDEGRYTRHAPHPSGPFKHQLMVSSVTASFELGARSAGIRYIPQHEILVRSGNELAVSIDNGLLRPDAVFALEIGGKYVVYFLEADRGTEPLRNSSTSKAFRKSWQRNVEQYRALIGRKIYRDYFKLNAPAVLLNVTISRERMDHMVEVLGEEFPRGCHYMLNYAFPEFGGTFKPPKMMDLLSVSWARFG